MCFLPVISIIIFCTHVMFVVCFMYKNIYIDETFVSSEVNNNDFLMVL